MHVYVFLVQSRLDERENYDADLKQHIFDIASSMFMSGTRVISNHDQWILILLDANIL